MKKSCQGIYLVNYVVKPTKLSICFISTHSAAASVGLVCRAFAPSAEGRRFDPRSGQVKDWKRHMLLPG